MLTIGLLSHLFKHENLGCVALSISNIILLDNVAEKINLKLHYVILTTDNLPQVELDFTNNSYEYRIFPRCKQSIKNPVGLIKSNVFDGCDFIMNLCGGDGFTDIYGFGRLMAESYMTILGKIKKKKLVFAPQTIGPFNSISGKFIAKVTLSSCYKIFSRDQASTQLCTTMGIKNKTTEVIDVAFALPYSKIDHKGDKFKIGINVSGLLYNGGYNKKNYFKLSFSYADFIDRLIELLLSQNYEIHLVPHVISDNNIIEDDYAACMYFAKKHNSTILAPKFKSAIDVKSYISGLDMFTGARMHSTIAAFSSGVPVVPVAYSRKFNGLYNTLDYKYIIDAKSNISIENAINKFLDYVHNVHQLKYSLDFSRQKFLHRLEKYEQDLQNIFINCL